jgi:hypothetical protein
MLYLGFALALRIIDAMKRGIGCHSNGGRDSLKGGGLELVTS